MTKAENELCDLIGRVALRDRSAFAALYEASGGKLYAICLRILRDRHEAEDALQEVFVRIWLRADRFRFDGPSPQAWMNAIARNYSIDKLRQRKPGAADLGEAEALLDAAPTPEEAAATISEGRQIALCLKELTPPRGEAVKRAYIEGETYQDLSERFQVPLNTLRSWLRRSLIQLRECLSR